MQLHLIHFLPCRVRFIQDLVITFSISCDLTYCSCIAIFKEKCSVNRNRLITLGFKALQLIQYLVKQEAGNMLLSDNIIMLR